MLAVPGPAYSAAADRTSAPAPTGGDAPLPRPAAPDRATGDDPALALGPGIPLAGASALADAARPGPGAREPRSTGSVARRRPGHRRRPTVVLDLSDRISTGGERGLLGLAVDPAGERLYLDFTDRPRRHRDPLVGRSAPTGCPIGGRGRAPPRDRPAVREPQRRQPRVRSRRRALDRHRRRRRAPATAARWPRTTARCSARCCGSSPTPRAASGARDQPATGSGPRDLGHRAAQPVALQLRPRHPPPLDRRRRPEHDRGGDGRRRRRRRRPTSAGTRSRATNDYEGEPEPAVHRCPVVTYGHDDGCSITGGYVYRGAAIPGLYGWYLYGDYCTGFIDAVPADDPTRRRSGWLRRTSATSSASASSRTVSCSC